jgi:hypothetical protein
MRRFGVLVLLLGLLGSAACEDTATTTPPKTAADDTAKTGDAPKVPASQLGHYASPDGFVGFVFDRTGDKPKMQMDKSNDIVELFLEDARDRGDKVGTWLNGPDGKHWLFLGENGGFAYIKPESRGNVDLRHIDSFAVSMGRDGDAKPLGAPTQKGIATPPPEKTEFDKAGEKLTAMSVVKRWPSFKPEDSGNLAKIEELLKSLDAAALVRISAQGSEKGHWAPASQYYGGAQNSLGGRVEGYPLDDAWDKNAKGIAKHGGALRARIAFGEPSRLRTATLKGWPVKLAVGTPGVVWMVDGTRVVFVSLDGGRYELELSNHPDKEGMPVEMGAGSPASWPAPIQHALIDVESIRGFAKGGAVPDKTGKDIEALDDGWWSCVNKAWDEGRKESDKIEASQDGADKKRGKLSSIPKRYEEKAAKDCEPAKKKLEEGLLGFIEARIKERTALYDKAKARAAALGVK